MGRSPTTSWARTRRTGTLQTLPLWYGVVCEEAAALDDSLCQTVVDKRGRTSPRSCVASPKAAFAGRPTAFASMESPDWFGARKHFTWMDTNHPAGTPRVGYPVEIQVLWIRLLRQLSRTGKSAIQDY